VRGEREEGEGRARESKRCGARKGRESEGRKEGRKEGRRGGGGEEGGEEGGKGLRERKRRRGT